MQKEKVNVSYLRWVVYESLSIYLYCLNPVKRTFRQDVQRHCANKKERIKRKIGNVKKLKSYVTEEAKNRACDMRLSLMLT